MCREAEALSSMWRMRYGSNNLSPDCSAHGTFFMCWVSDSSKLTATDPVEGNPSSHQANGYIQGRSGRLEETVA